MRQPITIDAAQTTIINGLESESFILSMDTSITTLRVKNMTPGLLYTFIMKQDHLGGHTINWGASVRNASALNPRPNGITVQNFIAESDGTLAANLPGTWS